MTAVDDYWRRIARISTHVADLPPESEIPITHYERGARDALNLVLYFERKLRGTGVYTGPFESHATRLRALALLALIESFERFVKELAAVCVDQLGGLVLDHRLSVFKIQSNDIPAHFLEGGLGKALTEAGTWLDSDKINERFRSLLADPFEKGSFEFLPRSASHPELPGQWRTTLDILWQLRHSITHNVGVITKSDAAKLRLLRQHPQAAPKVLAPQQKDVYYTKWFLDDLAKINNRRVAARLATVLEKLHADDPTLFNPAVKASEVAATLGETVTIAGATANP